MPTVRVSRTIAASPQRVWDVVGDPHHLPRWWPRVSRVEGVEEGAFTEVLISPKGKGVRADFRLVDLQPGRRVVWAQELEGTPFARVLRTAETEIGLRSATEMEAGAAGATEVAIELRQSLRGLFARLGSRFVRRAAVSTLHEALEGLERIVGA